MDDKQKQELAEATKLEDDEFKKRIEREGCRVIEEAQEFLRELGVVRFVLIGEVKGHNTTFHHMSTRVKDGRSLEWAYIHMRSVLLTLEKDWLVGNVKPLPCDKIREEEKSEKEEKETPLGKLTELKERLIADKQFKTASKLRDIIEELKEV